MSSCVFYVLSLTSEAQEVTGLGLTEETPACCSSAAGGLTVAFRDIDLHFFSSRFSQTQSE